MNKENSQTTADLIHEMNNYYDTRAPWHDDYMSYESFEKMEQTVQPILNRIIKLIENKSVLEIACGTGNWTQLLAKHACHITAVDFSQKSLELAKNKLSKFKNITLINDTAYELNKINDTYDIIFAADWWSHIPNEAIDEFMTVCKNKLKPNSKLIIIDMTCKEYFQKEKYELDSNNNRISLRKLPNGSEFKVIKNFPDKTELENIFKYHKMKMEHSVFDELERWMLIANLET